jgi:2-polyprenyl-6-methoxyphenol hydroxylase-like FAD-dependent oxidoreductase
MSSPTTSADRPAEQVQQDPATACAIVGGGPAGMILAYLLARQGVPTTLLEAHLDFDRDFRGDTVHPSTMELMDKLGLADKVLELPHGKLRQLIVRTPAGDQVMADFGLVKTKFPYIAMIPQALFLDFLAQEAKKFDCLRIVMGANVKQLIDEDGAVRGVRYQTSQGWHEVRAKLVVAADGRHSLLRRLGGFEPHNTSAPMDVVWFRLPKRPGDEGAERAMFYIGQGHGAVILDRSDEWQLALIVAKGEFKEIKAAGIERLRQLVAQIVTPLADRVDHLQGWQQVSVLSVESNRLPTWYKQGILCIGDAAHTMTPVGGVGINYAIQDAVAAANILAAPLKEGVVDTAQLAAVQHERELSVRFIQRVQSILQNRIIVGVLDPKRPFKLPWFTRIPVFRHVLARVIGYGIHVTRLADAMRESPAASSGR